MSSSRIGTKAKGKSLVSAKGKPKGGSNGRNSQTLVCYSLTMEDPNPVAVNTSPDQGQSDNDMGMVRPRRNGGLEIHIPVDTREQETRVPSLNRPSLDGMGEPLVDIPFGHSNESRGKDIWVRSFIIAIVGAKFERIRIGGRG